MLQKMKSVAKSTAQSAHKTIAANIIKAIALLLAVATVFTAVLYATHTIRISDGNKTYEMTTVFGTPDKMAQKVAAGQDYEIKSISQGFYSTDVVISYNFPLTLTVGNKTETYTVSSGKLGDILKELGVTVDEYDIVSHPLDTVFTSEAVVDIVDVEYKTEIFSEAIPYEKTVEYSDKYFSTTHKVVKTGHAGSKLVTCSVMYVNGVATTKTVLSEEVVSEAVDSKTVVGTRVPQYASSGKMMSTLEIPKNFALDANGVPVNYKSVKTLRATAYTHTGNRCSTGVWPEPGYVAVDPKEIPYGTKMYIVSADGRYVYGYAIAADTGGFIHGNRTDMDLFMDTEGQCRNFGRRDITVYFLD